ncbi:MAG: putative DNA-binding domain-containing protein [Rhodoferax sp.]|nr:putative DNA-binding domain-containing protein [Rhodoferax sp.]
MTNNAVSALSGQQQALLKALFAWPTGSAASDLAAWVEGDFRRGLMAYQANGHDMAERALAAAYPVMRELLGAASFGDLARAFWHAQPPRYGDLAQWGGGLDVFVKDSEQLADEPYLPDVAAVEWALHLAFHAADQTADTASFPMLMTFDPARLTLDLVPGCQVLQSPWPVVSILGAHRDGTPSLDEAGRRLRAAVAESAVVWREGLRACVREALTGEAVFLAALGAGASLATALDAAPMLDFNTWLPKAATTGLLLGVRSVAVTS